MTHKKAPPPPNEVTNFPVDKAWLALADHEETLEPDLAIVDSHHHLFDRADARYMLPDFLEDIAQGHRIIGSIHIEGGNYFLRPDGPPHMRAVGETEVIAGMTEQYVGKEPAICAGIVCYADFFEGAAVEEILDTHIALGQGRFVGIRQLTIWDDDESVRMYQNPPRRALSPGMTNDPKFREGFSKMGPRNLVFDTTAFHHQIPELFDLAKAFPDTRIILDHLGCIVQVGPYAGKNDEIFAAWKRDIEEIAQLDNVYVKIGGLGMNMYGFKFRDLPKPPSSQLLADTWKPYVETAIETFGVDHSMFESNFPVDKAYYGFATCWNAFKRLTANASDDEKAALYSRTAIKTYDLKI